MPKAVFPHILGSLAASRLEEALAQHELYFSEEAELHLVVVDAYQDTRLAAFNQSAFNKNQPYLMLKTAGEFLCAGPLVVPGQNACWCCLMDGLAGLTVDERLSRIATRPQFQFPDTRRKSAYAALIDEAASFITLWYNQKELGGSELAAFDVKTASRETYKIIKRSLCLVCGQPANAPQALQLSGHCVYHVSDGGFRSLAPEETLKNTAAHLNPLTGVIHDHQPLLKVSDGPAFIYGATFSIPQKDQPPVFKVSYGKGKTDAQAKTSAICEALEIYSRTFQEGMYTVVSTFEDQEGAIHPQSVLHYSAEQYEEREMLNASSFAVTDHIPEPFDESIEINWTAIWSLSEERFRYLPTAYCYDRVRDTGRRFCACDSNGHAAGNNLEEAILQGFFELVERDSIALWWYNLARVPGIDLASFSDPFIDDTIEFLASVGRNLVVLDITTDLGIPSFVAVSARKGQDGSHVVLGFGAHIDARLSVQRAVSELFQRLFVALAIEREEVQASNVYNEVQLYWWDEVTLSNHPFLKPSETDSLRSANTYPLIEERFLGNLLKRCINITANAGLEMLVLDQTNQDIGLSVAKVVVPGLRHQKRRLAPGRLYDVPMALGWTQQKRSARDLNPLSMMF